MLRIESMRHPAYVPQSAGLSHRASIAAVAILGLALLGVTATALRHGAPVPVSGEPERAAARPLLPSHGVPALPAAPSGRLTVVREQPAPLDPNAPVAVAVRSQALLAALVSLEEEGDTTETSEGLESIAATGAVVAELTGPAPRASLLADLSDRLPPMGGRTVAATIELPSTGGVREVTLGEKPDAKLSAQEPGAELVSAVPAVQAPSDDGDA